MKEEQKKSGFKRFFFARNRELAHDFWRTDRRLWELAKDSARLTEGCGSLQKTP